MHSPGQNSQWPPLCPASTTPTALTTTPTTQCLSYSKSSRRATVFAGDKDAPDITPHHVCHLTHGTKGKWSLLPPEKDAQHIE